MIGCIWRDSMINDIDPPFYSIFFYLSFYQQEGDEKKSTFRFQICAVNSF